MNWRTELRPTDLCDPETGESLYVRARIRPRWFWTLRRIKLFLAIVWRSVGKDVDGHECRMDVRTAWTVSEVAMGLEK